MSVYSIKRTTESTTLPVTSDTLLCSAFFDLIVFFLKTSEQKSTHQHCNRAHVSHRRYEAQSVNHFEHGSTSNLWNPDSRPCFHCSHPKYWTVFLTRDKVYALRKPHQAIKFFKCTVVANQHLLNCSASHSTVPKGTVNGTRGVLYSTHSPGKPPRPSLLRYVLYVTSPDRH